LNPQLIQADPMGPAPAQTASCAPASAPVGVEIADAARFAELRQAWTDLTARAAEPNPFLDPGFVAAAAGEPDARRTPIVLAWQGQRLVGVWAFVQGRPRSGLPIGILSAPIHPTAADSTPVIDRDLVEPVLAAMVEAIEASPVLPKLVSLRFLNAGGPVMDALGRVMAARRSPSVVLAEAVRPRLTCSLDPKTYFAQAMSGSRRRKLGQLRRRLAGRGALELSVHRGAGPVAAALDRFLALEAAGWKGTIGHSLLRTALGFTRTAVPALALHDGAEIWELSLDRQEVSMAIILRQSGGAFDWKIAYDERHADCSPGVLLAQDYTTEFLQNPAIAFADSCAADDTGLLGPLWTERHPMADMILDVRAGGSPAFTIWSALERCYRAARSSAKGPAEFVRGRLRHFSRQRARAAEAE
jgi:CelD/BcsL family acetyltransferase involved in cellulose biosynthesis